jgi:hypothetical protein
MHTIAIERSPDLRVACHRFLDDIGAWVFECIAEFGDQPPTEKHDQATYTTGWEPYIHTTAEAAPLQFMKELRDQIARKFTDEGVWAHGYWKQQEAHHGTEHFELFLATLWRLDPGDFGTVSHFLDAAEHLGNWSEEVPEWFDWQAGIFHSMYFGANGVFGDTGSRLNIPDHFRCLSLALIAHDMSDDAHYLELASLYGGRWADAILDRKLLPVGLDNVGGVYALNKASTKAYHGVRVQTADLRENVNRAENMLASSAVDALVRLWQLTNEERFRRAACKLLDVLTEVLNDPDAGPAADCVRHYRQVTEDTAYDSRVAAAVESLGSCEIRELGIEPIVQRDSKPAGVGKRKDMPQWFEDGGPRRHNPILLALAAEISGDESLATRTVDLARAYFRLARKVYPSGRHHGCSSRSVSAVCRGHGRDNHAGMTTAVLSPIMATFGICEPFTHFLNR